MNYIFREYLKKWYLFVFSLVLIFPSAILGMLILYMVNGITANLPISYTVASVLIGLLSTIPIQVINFKIWRNCKQRKELIVISVLTILIFSLLGLFVMTYRV